MSDDDIEIKLRLLDSLPGDEVPVFPAKPDELVGQLVGGRYRVERLIGRGGMGSVYYVEQVFLKKHFALKLVLSTNSDTARLRFQKEAMAASKLDHPNIARTLDFGSIDATRIYMVMEYVDGLNLSQYLQKQVRISAAEAFEIFIPIVFALDHAHGQGVVHRDIKPSNIVLVPSTVAFAQYVPKLLDFGIAKLLDESETEALTKTGEIFGTPLYISPEQCSGLPVDERSDIYSLGCVLYEALTGAPPFQGRTALETMMMHRVGEPMSLSQASLGLDIPVSLQRIVSKMIAKDPEDRYPSCVALSQDLVSIKQGGSLVLRPEKKPEASAKAKTKLPLMVLTACITLLVGGLIFKFPSITSKPTSHDDSQQKTQKGASIDNPLGNEIGIFGMTLPSYFSSPVPNDPAKLQFDFGQDNLGDILPFNPDSQYHWQTTNTVRAQYTQLLPGNSFALIPNEYFVCAHPMELLRFRPGELGALLLNTGHNLVLNQAEDKTPYFDSFLSYARGFSGLRALDVSYTPVSSIGLYNIDLDQMSQLKCLLVGPSFVDGRILAKSKILNQLIRLSVSDISHGRLVLLAVAHSETLQDLNISGIDLTDSDLISVSHMKSLKTLGINRNPKITAAGLANLENLPQLEGLSITNTGVSPSSLMNMPWLRHLKWLILHKIDNDAERKKLEEFLPSTSISWDS